MRDPLAATVDIPDADHQALSSTISFSLIMLAHVDQGVAHAAQCGVDAHIGVLRDLLEAHAQVGPHHHHIALFIWQVIDQLAHILIDLHVHHAAVPRSYRLGNGGEHIVVIVAPHQRHLLVRGGNGRSPGCARSASPREGTCLPRCTCPLFRVWTTLMKVSWKMSSVNSRSRTSR